MEGELRSLGCCPGGYIRYLSPDCLLIVHRCALATSSSQQPSPATCSHSSPTSAVTARVYGLSPETKSNQTTQSHPGVIRRRRVHSCRLSPEAKLSHTERMVELSRHWNEWHAWVPPLPLPPPLPQQLRGVSGRPLPLHRAVPRVVRRCYGRQPQGMSDRPLPLPLSPPAAAAMRGVRGSCGNGRQPRGVMHCPPGFIRRGTGSARAAPERRR